MPRRTTPSVYLALPVNTLAAAFDIHPRHIYQAIAEEKLEVRSLPGSNARRILIRDAERWFRKHWQK
jgi:hypothetical protein